MAPTISRPAFCLNDVSYLTRCSVDLCAAVGSYGVTMTIRPAESALPRLFARRRRNMPRSGRGDLRHGGRSERGRQCGCFYRSGRSNQVSGRQIGGFEHRLVSCDVWAGRFQSIRVARNHRLPRVWATRVQISRRRSPAAHHHVRTRFRADPRAKPQTRSRRTQPEACDAPRGGEIRNNDFLLRFRVPPL